jgi:glycine/D-amino acid oxidase-like deaminating enzyme
MEWAKPLWRDGARQVHHPPLSRDSDADVVVVGAGFSGLWTAHHLASLDPSLDILVLDARQPGFGASGRNGGWCSAMFPVPFADLARMHGEQAAIAQRDALTGAVSAVGSFIEERSIDAGWTKGGTLTVATNEAQVERLTADLASAAPLSDTEVRWLPPDELATRVKVAGALGAVFDPHCAALDPQALVDGLVASVTAAGVRIHGSTSVSAVGNGYVETHGDGGHCWVTARHVVLASEAWNSTFKGRKRSVAPLYSYVVATEPLSAAAWDDIGWSGRETLAEGRRMVTYAQRTADGRIVFGGRGAPYAFGSDIHSSRDTNERVHTAVVETMHELFPAAADARITHRWGGPLGVPRDWHPSVHTDPRSGATVVGGYTGDGVALSWLAGRIAAHRIALVDDPVLSLPMNGHRPRRWEPEPLRWAGINTGLVTTRLADSHERRTGRSSRLLEPLMRLF